MKLKKTAIAVAIAGVAAAPMMASAATTISGVVQVKVQGTDADDDEADFAAGDVRVGIATDHELNSGLTGYGNLQLNLDDLTGQGGVAGQGVVAQEDLADPDGSLTDADLVELTSSATVASDNVYVGVKGDFGDIRWGEIPLAVEYGQLANDIHDVGGTVADGLSYTGSFGMFGVGLNYSPSEDSDMFGAGAKFNIAGATIGVGFEDRDEKSNYSVGASYAIGGVSLAGQYWALGADDDSDLDDQTNVAVKAGYTISDVTLGLTYSLLTTPVGEDTDSEETAIRLDASYALGGSMDLSTRIQSTSIDDGDDDDENDADDLLEWRVMLSKSF